MNADPDDARLDEWIDRHLADFTDTVNEALDIEAGLRDARLPDRARSLDTTLDLDIDAGLQAIVARNSVPQEPVGSESTPELFDLLANDLMQRPLRVRLAMRSHLPGKELLLIRRLAEACAANNAMMHGFANYYGSARVLDLALTSALDLADDRALALDLTRTRVIARDLARGRDHAPELTKVLDSRLGRYLNDVLGRVVDNAVNYVLGGRVDTATRRVVDGSLASLIMELHGTFHRYRRLRKFGDLAAGVKALELVVADFTNADLADEDLRGVVLRGVRWSLVTTRWPPGWEDPMREASTQVDPDRHPDLYEVRDDPRVRHTVQ